MPIGEEAGFYGVVDLISGKAFTWGDDESGKVAEMDVPAELADEVARAREALMEMVAEQDEELMEAYLEDGELDQETLSRVCEKAITAPRSLPGLRPGRRPRTSACSRSWMHSWTWSRPRLAAGHRPPWAARKQELAAFADEPFSAYVFKTLSDPFTGRITLFRVFSGGVATDANVGQPPATSVGAPRRSVHHAGQGARARDRARPRRHRRRSQAQGHPHRRHPVRSQERHRAPTVPIPEGGHQLRPRAQVQG